MPLIDLKFLNELAAGGAGTSNRRHWKSRGTGNVAAPSTKWLGFAQWTLAGVLITAIASAGAAPNSQLGPKKDDGFQTTAPNAILIDADSGTVLY